MSEYIGCRIKKTAIKQIDEYVKTMNLDPKRLTTYTRSDFLRYAIEKELEDL